MKTVPVEAVASFFLHVAPRPSMDRPFSKALTRFVEDAGGLQDRLDQRRGPRLTAWSRFRPHDKAVLGRIVYEARSSVLGARRLPRGRVAPVRGGILRPALREQIKG